MDKTENIKLTAILKAQKVFEDFRKNLTTDQHKAGAVQAFEFCYELSWKLMKRVLESEGLEVGSPKDSFRKAALNHLIDEPEVWFDFQEKRNLTVHSYDRENMNLIISIFDNFSNEVEKLITRVKER